MSKPNIQLIKGDCLEVMKTLPSESVDCCITDPPYFRIKNSYWDNQWDNEQNFINWIEQLCAEWQRILKPNGSLYCFASPKLSAKVEVAIGKYLNVLNNIVWQKCENSYMAKSEDFLRQFVPTSERIIFAEQFNENGFTEAISKSLFAIRDYIRAEILRSQGSINFKQINSVLGTATNGGGVASATLSLDKTCPAFITEEHYNRLREWLNQTNGGGYLSQDYSELLAEYETSRKNLEHLRRPFSLTNKHQHTDVWFYQTEQSFRYHECQKPLEMIRFMIRTSSRENQTILDCTMGSGTTGVASVIEKRNFIGIERDERYFNVAEARINRAQLKPVDIPINPNNNKVLPLFEE